MFKTKLKIKYPVEKSRKCHEKAIPTAESTKNQIANKYAMVNPPISYEHKNKIPTMISKIPEISATQLRAKKARKRE